MSVSCLIVPARTRSAQRLVELRINEGMSRAALAARAGIGRETVRLVEGGFVPSVSTQFAIAAVFKLRPLDIWPLETQREVRS